MFAFFVILLLRKYFINPQSERKTSLDTNTETSDTRHYVKSDDGQLQNLKTMYYCIRKTILSEFHFTYPPLNWKISHEKTWQV